MARRAPGDCDIMIVEDDALAGKLLEMLIARQTGLRVRLFRTSDQATRSLRQAAAEGAVAIPRAIITDVHLAEGDSLSMIQWVRAAEATSGIRVLVVSADETEKTHRAAIDAGADLVASKADFLASVGIWVGKLLPGEAGASIAA